MARARRAARRDRGRGQDARAAAHRVPRVRASTPTTWLARRRALRGAGALRPRGPGPRRRLGGGRRRPPPPTLLPPPVTGPRRRRPSARCSTACSRARRSASTRSSRCSARAGPRSLAVAEVADELRRDAVGDVVTFVRNRNINYTNVCTFKCRFCAFSKGPLSLNLRGDPYLLDLEEIQRRVVEAVECGATEVCLQGGIHPDFDGDYYLDVARAVKEVAPDIHVHGFTALEVTEGARRLGMPLRDYLAAGQGGRAWRRCPAPRPRSSTTRCGRSSAPTRSTPTSGSRRTAPRTRSACARTSRSCSATSSGRSTSPATSCAPGRCSRRPAGSPSSSRCRSCTWRRRSSCSSKARTGPTFREVAAHARGRPHRLPRLDRQHPGVVGEDRRHRRAPGAAGRRATTSAAR